LIVRGDASGVVAFAHGSGSSRRSPRNRFVARELQQAGLATLLLDLLEEEEAGDRHLVFDFEPLARRLLAAARPSRNRRRQRRRVAPVAPQQRLA
jgi:putative phosphoribosyl transferase